MYPKFPRSLEPKKGVAEKSVFATFSNFNTKLHRSVTIKLTKILRDILWTKKCILHTDPVPPTPVLCILMDADAKLPVGGGRLNADTCGRG